MALALGMRSPDFHDLLPERGILMLLTHLGKAEGESGRRPENERMSGRPYFGFLESSSVPSSQFGHTAIPYIEILVCQPLHLHFLCIGLTEEGKMLLKVHITKDRLTKEQHNKSI